MLTKEEIVRLAQKAGLGPVTISALEFRDGSLSRFAALVSDAERERIERLREALQPLADFTAELEMPEGAFRMRAKKAMTYEKFQTACRALRQIIGDQP